MHHETRQATLKHPDHSVHATLKHPDHDVHATPARGRRAAVERTRYAIERHFGALREEADSDRGDVPGWVLITLMSAGLVAVIWAIAESSLTGLFDDAISSVTGG